MGIRFGNEPHLPKPQLGYTPLYANILDNEGIIIITPRESQKCGFPEKS